MTLDGAKAICREDLFLSEMLLMLCLFWAYSCTTQWGFSREMCTNWVCGVVRAFGFEAMLRYFGGAALDVSDTRRGFWNRSACDEEVIDCDYLPCSEFAPCEMILPGHSRHAARLNRHRLSRSC
jgi:hypothetical protein